MYVAEEPLVDGLAAESVGMIVDMTVRIAGDLEAQLLSRAKAEGISADEYVARLIREDGEWGEIGEAPLDDTDRQFADIRIAVEEGIQQAELRESRPAGDVFGDLRDRLGIPR